MCNQAYKTRKSKRVKTGMVKGSDGMQIKEVEVIRN